MRRKKPGRRNGAVMLLPPGGGMRDHNHPKPPQRPLQHRPRKAIELMRELLPLLGRILPTLRRHDKALADQLRRAASSVLLPVAVAVHAAADVSPRRCAGTATSTAPEEPSQPRRSRRPPSGSSSTTSAERIWLLPRGARGALHQQDLALHRPSRRAPRRAEARPRRCDDLAMDAPEVISSQLGSSGPSAHPCASRRFCRPLRRFALALRASR